MVSFDLDVDDNGSHVPADSDSSDGNISGDDSSSSVEHMPFGELTMRAMMVLVLVVAALTRYLVRFGVLVACRICIIF